VLHTAAARVGGLDLGFVPGEGGKDAAMLAERRSVPAGADELEIAQEDRGFTVYIGTHGDRGAHHADVILPAPPTRKSRRPTSTPKAGCSMAARRLPAGRGREDWAILRAFRKLGKTLPFDSLEQLRAALYAEHPHLARNRQDRAR
jgi:NADH-quinone oxidoreductase subunit G